MPLPIKRKGENTDDFVKRCMSSEQMKREFPDNDQRLAVCQRRSNLTEHRFPQRATSEIVKGKLKTVWLDKSKSCRVLAGPLQESNEMVVQSVAFKVDRWDKEEARRWLHSRWGYVRDCLFEYVINRWAGEVSIELKLSEAGIVELQSPREVEFEEKQKAIIKGVKFLGLESQNRRSYAPEAIKNALHLYEGTRVNIDHDLTSASRKVRDRIGTLKNVRFEESKGAFGDLHLNPRHPWSETIIGWAQTEPSAIGLSHQANGRARKSADGTLVVEEIRTVRGVDIVADAATTKGLFEHKEDLSKGNNEVEFDELDIVTLKKERPDLFEEIENRVKNKDEAKQLQEENEQLKKKLDDLETKQKLQEFKEEVDTAVKDAELPERALTEAFQSTLYGQSKIEDVKALIEDRKKLVESSTPRSTGKDQSTQAGKYTDHKEFAKALKGRK